MMYKVFEIDVYFSTYGMETVLVGAIDEEDLKKHITQKLLRVEGEFYPPISNKKFIEKLEEEERIKEVPHLFTDEPYKVIERYFYAE